MVPGAFGKCRLTLPAGSGRSERVRKVVNRGVNGCFKETLVFDNLAIGPELGNWLRSG